MKKSILNLKGAQELSKNEQKAVNGGKLPPQPTCSNGTFPVTLNKCLCGSGTYTANPSNPCSGGAWTHSVWENATGCCYNFADGNL